METFREFQRRHDALKRKIHSFKIPLGPFGLAVMKVVYFVAPLVIGLSIMNFAIGKAEDRSFRVKNLLVDDQILQKEASEESAQITSILGTPRS